MISCPECFRPLDSPVHGVAGGACDKCGTVWTDVWNKRCPGMTSKDCGGTIEECKAPFWYECDRCGHPLRLHAKGKCTRKPETHTMSKGYACLCPEFVPQTKLHQIRKRILGSLPRNEGESILKEYDLLTAGEAAREEGLVV